ncbi:hypothetical protein FB645_004534 [Coemansia sp. IMI 203386]|nr:hypothetical protein FB645_004534 [Coemansia sp. IMI 203386]
MASFRFYEAEFPEINDVVMVKIKSIKEMGAYVQLEEYGNIEGMILFAELSRRRIRSVQKLVRIGCHEPALVYRVDKNKGYIDLSKAQVSHEQREACKIKFEKSKHVHLIICSLAKRLESTPEELYQKFGWALYKKHGHAYDAFKAALTEPEEVFGEFNLEPKVLEELLAIISRDLRPQRSKLRADIEVTCSEYQGIEAIRKALKAGEDVSTENTPIKIRLIAPPQYTMSTTSVDKQADLMLMEKAIEEIRKVIVEEGGSLKVIMGPKAVSENEEKELQDFMERAERENAEVDGDDDEGSADEY